MNTVIHTYIYESSFGVLEIYVVTKPSFSILNNDNEYLLLWGNKSDISGYFLPQIPIISIRRKLQNAQVHNILNTQITLLFLVFKSFQTAILYINTKCIEITTFKPLFWINFYHVNFTGIKILLSITKHHHSALNWVLHTGHYVPWYFCDSPPVLACSVCQGHVGCPWMVKWSSWTVWFRNQHLYNHV